MIRMNSQFATIVESGSNDNGGYIKFADGTMICYGTLKCPILSGSTGINVNVNLPYSFANANYNVVLTRAINIAHYAAIEEATINKKNTSFETYFFNTNASASTSEELKFDYIAIGQWK